MPFLPPRGRAWSATGINSDEVARGRGIGPAVSGSRGESRYGGYICTRCITRLLVTQKWPHAVLKFILVSCNHLYCNHLYDTPSQIFRSALQLPAG